MENEKTNTKREINFRRIARITWEHRWWFVAGLIVCVTLGVLYYMRKAPKWTTNATIMLRQKDGQGVSIEALSMLGLSGNTAAEDEVVVLSSRGLMYQAIDALNLWDDNSKRSGWRWEGDFPNPALSIEYVALTQDAQDSPFTVTVRPSDNGYKVKTKIGFFKRSSTQVSDLGEPIETKAGTLIIHANRTLSSDTTYRVVHKRKELVVSDYQKQMDVRLQKKESNIINLAITSPVPARDKALLYKLIEQYNMNAVTDKNMIATNTAAFIDERLAIITAELNEAEEAVAHYKENNNIADIHKQASLFLQASSEEQRAMQEVETQLRLVEYIDEFLRDESKRDNLIPANIGVSDASLSASLTEYNALLLQRMRILRTATDDNPVIEQMNAQLASMRTNIIETIGSVRESLKIRQRSLQIQVSKFDRQIRNAPAQEREYVRVVRQQQIKESLYLFMYEKREENALMLAATAMPAKIIDLPEKDVKSRSPKLPRLLLISILLGLLIPAILLYIYRLFSNKIDDAKEFEQSIHAPMLGQLVKNSRNAHIAIHEGESTVSAELFRLIRTNLKFIIPADTKSPVVLVTSCISGEGKSYVSCNTALSLAMLGKKVALVGMDIRQPMLAAYFNLSTKGHLTDYLAEPDVTIDDIIVPSGEHPNLDLIPCGTIPPNPAELLQSERVDQLFAELRKRYDYILVDSAPIALVSDTYQLDRIADATIFVCRYKHTPLDMIDYINRVIEQKRMHNAACVLNGVKSSRAGYGYGAKKK